MILHTRVLLTVVGDDRPGLTRALSAAIFESGGNWLEGNLSRLGGKFVGAILVDLPAERSADLRARLAADSAGLQVEIHPVGEDKTTAEAVTLSLTSADRPGIVHELSLVLARLGANIVELETSAEDGAWQGNPIFRATARLTLPAGLTHAALQEALEQLSGDLMVELEPA
ncbi:amino acid-binding protein [Sandaracinobacter neustonicus]|uniref:Amino acid-binding protein n=1 Tax=Sandaracinobacter neustonicus TaxID=1715348 RepID=A0A501XPE3_9SPHN|nr:ACT domain-containing protein [Sandaracinobacter neustonicus]TPE62163.1 amino acid-binding protein [Sandaracinobacter neustonicus]